ncbi:TPA: hypothetical protein ACVO1V_002938 [Legionella pneumophila]
MNTSLKYSVALVLSGLITTQVLAQSIENKSAFKYSPWSITASLGMEQFDSMEGLHGQTALGRLTFGYALTNHFGLETGIQNGNQMRLALPKKTVDVLGGVPVVGTAKPLIDALITVKTPPLSSTIPLFLEAKGGVAYRQLQMDRETMNDRSQFSPELQVGLGYTVREHLNVNLMVQYVLGKNPDVTVDAVTERGWVANIPTQKAILLGLTLNLE